MKCENCGVEITDRLNIRPLDDDSYLCADCFDELYDLEDEDEDEDKDTIQ